MPLLFALLVLVLGWPAILNGYPLMYDDSGVYIGYPETIYSPYPPLYIVAIRLVHAFSTLDGVVLAQAIIAGYVVAAAFVRLGNVGWTKALWATIALAVFTQLPWLASWVTPDIFGGIGLLALIALVFSSRRDWHDLVLIAIVTGAGLVATSNGLITIACLPVMLVARWLWSGVDRAILIGAIGIGGVLAVVPPVTNKLLQGQFVYATGSSARLFSTLVDRKLAQPYLAARCRAGDAFACDLSRQIASFEEDEEFMWGRGKMPALADKYDAWNDRSHAFARYSRGAILANPLAFAHGAVFDVVSLAGEWTLGERGREMKPQNSLASSVYFFMGSKYQGEFARFMRARQQRDTLLPVFPTGLYVITTLLGYLGALTVAVLAARRGDRRLLAIAVATIIAILASTAVHGGLSATVARYTVKVSWLASVVLILGLFQLQGWRNARAN